MKKNHCSCPDHHSKDFRTLTDHYSHHFIADGWALDCQTLDAPEDERYLYLTGRCSECNGKMQSGVSIGCNLTGEALIRDIWDKYHHHRPYDGRVSPGIYRGAVPLRADFYAGEDQLPHNDKRARFLRLFRAEHRPQVKGLLEVLLK